MGGFKLGFKLCNAGVLAAQLCCGVLGGLWLNAVFWRKFKKFR